MSLKDDLDAMDRAEALGKLKEFVRGEFTLPPEPYPTDPSARPIYGNYTWMKARGD